MVRVALGFMLSAALVLPSVGAAQAPERIIFATDWLAQAEHGGFYQAVAEGIYKKHGLDVTIKMGGPQVNGLQLLAAGQLDVVMGDALQVVSAIEQNVPVTAIAATFQKNPTAIIAHPGVAKLQDLKGKPIAIAAASNTTFWPWLKQRYGFTDDQKRPYAFSVQPFLVDPALSQQGFATSEPFSIEKGGVVPVVFLLADLGYPPYSEAAGGDARHLGQAQRCARPLRSRVGGGMEELSRQPCSGQCAHQARQSADERRVARVQPSQDEGIRDRRRRRCRDAWTADDDRRALDPDDRLPALGRVDQAGHRLRESVHAVGRCAT